MRIEIWTIDSKKYCPEDITEICFTQSAGIACDSLSVSFKSTDLIQEITEVKAFDRGELIFNGYCDQQRICECDKGFEISIFARSSASLLTDNEAEPFTYNMPSAKQLWFTFAKDFGFKFASCFRQIFADTATEYGLSMFCEMFGIDSSLGYDEKRILIAEGMGRIFGLSSLTDIGKAVEELGNDFSVSCKEFNMVISGTIDHSADVLTRLGKIIENYLPPCTVVKFCSDGLDFDNWDSSPYLFKNYDNFNLSFDILDTLRRTNEQYK